MAKHQFTPCIPTSRYDNVKYGDKTSRTRRQVDQPPYSFPFVMIRLRKIACQTVQIVPLYIQGIVGKL